MKRLNLFYALIASLALLLSGCVVRTYQLSKERVDQDLTGNRGYLTGQAPESEALSERASTRTTQVVEVELHSPIKFVRSKKISGEKVETEATESEEGWGNRGYISGGETSEGTTAKFTQYTVKKNDTLQKISKEFYGTTRKWNKIYEANKGTLKGPDKVYPGQVLNIPEDTTNTLKLQEPEQNLK